MQKYIYANANPVSGIDPSGFATFVYIHSGAHWYGHAAIDVNGTVYTFGRYQASATIPSYSGGTKGGGFLFKVPTAEYFNNPGFTSSQDTVDRYFLNYSPAEEREIAEFFESRYRQAGETTTYSGQIGKMAGEYRFVAGANNCTTLIRMHFLIRV